MIPIKTWRIALPSLRDAPPVLLEARAQILRRCVARSVARRHHDVHRRQFVLAQAKALAYEALDAVPRHCAAEGTRRDCQTQARTSFMIRHHRQAKKRVGQPLTTLPYRAKFGRLVQTLSRLEGQPGGQRGDRSRILRSASGTETFAALRATTSQQPTAAFRGHARTETMSSGTVQITGIKSTFHSATLRAKRKGQIAG
jgi:hypothetical protein